MPPSDAFPAFPVSLIRSSWSRDPSTDVSVDPLARYGWDAEWAAAAPDARPGRVVRVDKSHCEVVTAQGPVVVGMRGLRAATGDTICTGDWVTVTSEGVADTAVGASAADPTGLRVGAVLPRRSALVRAAASGRSEGQVLAANVDVVAVVVACRPEPDLGRIERLLALAWESGARPVVILTKADAVEDPAAVVETVAGAAVGVEVVLTSAHVGEGLDALGAVLTGTIVLVGQSGVGKSTLANLLTGGAAAIADVRARDGKGRHTTVTRELTPLTSGRGVLIDTPGLRGVGLYDAADGLARTFVDVDALAADCRFGDCAHDAEPGCAVRAAVDAGQLPARRLDSYHKLARENEWAASRTDARLRAERKARERSVHRELRRTYRERGR